MDDFRQEWPKEGLTWTQNRIRLRQFPRKKFGTHLKEL